MNFYAYSLAQAGNLKASVLLLQLVWSGRKNGGMEGVIQR